MNTPSRTRGRSKSNWRRIVRVIHRDFGYFFTGATIIYCLSGILVNHNDTINPDFDIETRTVAFELPAERDAIDDALVEAQVAQIGEHGAYQGYGFASDKRIKVYFDDGSLVSMLGSGVGEYETIERRELIFRINKLHLHPRGWWRVFADAFAIGLLVISLTGLFILKGRKGLWGRGKWFVAAGVAFPVLAMFVSV